MREAWAIMQFLLVFAAVLIVARWVSGYLARNLRASGQNLEIVESLGLGARRVLCLVRAGDKYLVLGVTDQSIRLLDSLDDIEDIPRENVSGPGWAWLRRGDKRE